MFIYFSMFINITFYTMKHYYKKDTEIPPLPHLKILTDFIFNIFSYFFNTKTNNNKQMIYNALL